MFFFKEKQKLYVEIIFKRIRYYYNTKKRKKRNNKNLMAHFDMVYICVFMKA